MDRCDFSSIMTYLKNQISESNQMSQPEFLYEIFEDFLDSPENKEFTLDNVWLPLDDRPGENQSQNIFFLCKTKQSGKTGENYTPKYCPLNG